MAMTQEELFEFWDREVARSNRIIFVNGDRVKLTKWFHSKYDTNVFYMKSQVLKNESFKALTIEEL